MPAWSAIQLLVVPNIDDVFEFEREVCAARAALGGTVTTFGGLFREVLHAAGSPPGAELAPAQRLRAVTLAIAERRERLGPLRHSARRPGFALAFERLLGELQAGGLDPAQLGHGAETLESSAYLGDLATLAAAYADVRRTAGAGRLAPDRPRGDLRAAGGRRLLERTTALPLRSRRPHRQPTRADRSAWRHWPR